MFCLIDFSSFVEKYTPNVLTEKVAHFNSLFGRRVILLFFDALILLAYVLVLFILVLILC